jgi:hypothetical protein
MDEKQFPSLSVEQLQDHWRQLHALENGEFINVLSIYEMPSWNDICLLLDWRMHSLDTGYFSDKDYGRCGVYRLVALEAPRDLRKVATLNRVCGQDSTGTLYIGEAGNLATRMNQMRRTAKPRRSESSHGALSMLRRISRFDLPREKLGVAFMYTGRHTDSVERDLLHAYINSFGEMPPLNYRL